MKLKVIFLIQVTICCCMAATSDLGKYTPDTRGNYVHDKSWEYTPDKSGEYKPDNRGAYVSDNSGQYVPDNSGSYKNIPGPAVLQRNIPVLPKQASSEITVLPSEQVEVIEPPQLLFLPPFSDSVDNDDA